MMQNHFAGTAYDSHRLLTELDLNTEERKKPIKEITPRFSARQYDTLKSFERLGLKKS